MQKIAKFIYFKIIKWKLVGDFPEVDKCVMIVVSHTSYVDFFLGLLVRKVWNKEINFIGKESLFKFPLIGWYLKWVGGAPIVRDKKSDTVAAIANIFKTKKVFRLSLTPEGTRKKVTEWKTGFYYIAKLAQVPVVMVAFDFKHKQVKISQAYFTTDDKEADLKIYKSFFKGVVGRIPEKSYKVE
jgi:1-acyl-sn-glycerol-3-phosphate acyltransferase